MGKHNKESKVHSKKMIIVIFIIAIIVAIAISIYFVHANKVKQENIKVVQSESAQPEEATETEKSALDIMKQYWGEDDSVYFTLDSQNGDEYIIAVRSVETTGALNFYKVNIKTEEVKLDE